MSEIKWRVYEPDDEEDLHGPEGDERAYIFIDRVDAHEPYGQFSGSCSPEELADLKRRLEGETEWRTIDSAPKDGTRVLIADEDVWMTVARFWPCNMYWAEDAASGMRLNDPTHWMPLPPSPKEETDEDVLAEIEGAFADGDEQ